MSKLMTTIVVILMILRVNNSDGDIGDSVDDADYDAGNDGGVDGYDDDIENDTSARQYKLTEYLYILPGPTLKLRRPIVSKMFKDKIDALYEDEHHWNQNVI